MGLSTEAALPLLRWTCLLCRMLISSSLHGAAGRSISHELELCIVMQLILRVQPSGGNDDTAYSSIAFEQDHSLKRLRIANHMHLWFSEIFQVHHLAEL